MKSMTINKLLLKIILIIIEIEAEEINVEDKIEVTMEAEAEVVDIIVIEDIMATICNNNNTLVT